jgi:hypothetical protein
MLQRIWTGIVGGVAGVAITVAVAIALGRNALTPERILMAWGIGGAIGLILGVVLAKPKNPTG